ncbi:MAG: prolipoprotein diacylglyceryl transferase family protein [Nannocystaceae bacterium]
MRPEFLDIPGSGLTIPSYALFLALGLVAGWVLSRFFAQRRGLQTVSLGQGYTVSTVVGLLSARLWWLLTHPESFSNWTEMVQLQSGQISGGVGLACALVVTALHCQLHGISIWAWLDCLAPAVLTVVGCERIGAFLAGADFGHVTDAGFVLAVRFPADSPAFAYHQEAFRGLRSVVELSLPVHPVQLYVALPAFVAAGLASRWHLRHGTSTEGRLAWLTLAFLALVFYIGADAFRAGASPVAFAGIRRAQLIGGALVAMAFALDRYRLRRSRSGPRPAVRGGPRRGRYARGDPNRSRRSDGRKPAGKPR